MKNVTDKLYTRTISAALALCAAFVMFLFVGKGEAQTPVARHGLISTSGNQVVNAQGQPVQLRGMSLFWSHSRDARHFYNAATVGHLRNDWGADVVRAAMAVNLNWSNDEVSYLGGGHNPQHGSDSAGNWNRVTTVIEAAKAQGMYVIVDWHAYYQHTNGQSNTLPPAQRAVNFFVALSNKYPQADNPHIIWEIFNEPVGTHHAENGGADATAFWNNSIRPWANTVARAIRANGDDRLIIVGTPFFCQAPDIAAANPLRMSDAADAPLIPHVAYSAHFYAGSTGSGVDDHNIGLQRRIIRTMSVYNLPVFISECGTVRADGAGQHDGPRSTLWMEFLEQYKIGWAAWSLSSMNQGSAALVGNAQALATQNTPWADNQLSESGRFFRNELRRTEPRTRRFASVRLVLEGQGTIASTPPSLIVAGQDNITATVRLVSPDYPFIGWSISNGASGTGTPVQGQPIPTFRVDIPTTTAMITPGGVADGGEIVVTLRFAGETSVSHHASLNSTRWDLRRTSSGVSIAGPAGTSANAVFYNISGRAVHKQSVTGGTQMLIGRGVVPAGNYIVVLRDKSSGRELHRSQVSLVN